MSRCLLQKHYQMHWLLWIQKFCLQSNATHLVRSWEWTSLMQTRWRCWRLFNRWIYSLLEFDSPEFKDKAVPNAMMGCSWWIPQRRTNQRDRCTSATRSFSEACSGSYDYTLEGMLIPNHLIVLVIKILLKPLVLILLIFLLMILWVLFSVFLSNYAHVRIFAQRKQFITSCSMCFVVQVSWTMKQSRTKLNRSLAILIGSSLPSTNLNNWILVNNVQGSRHFSLGIQM